MKRSRVFVAVGGVTAGLLACNAILGIGELTPKPGALTFDGSALTFSSACGAQSSGRTIVITNGSLEPATWSAALERSPSPFSIDNPGGTLDPGVSANIVVGIAALDASIATTASDRLTIATPTGKTTIELAVHTGGPALVVTPTALDIGNTPYRGTSPPLPVTIRNVGTAPASVSIAIAAPFAASVTGTQTIAPDASFTTFVTVSATAQGGISGSLDIQVLPPTVLCGAAPGAVPITAKGVNGPIMLAESVRNMCVLMSDNTVYCWGNAGSGQLGNGTPANKLTNIGTPQKVPGLSGKIVAIGAGYQYACVSFEPNGLACWGSNEKGQGAAPAGPSNLTPSYYDGSIGLGNEIPQIAAGGLTTYVRGAGGRLYCFGDNAEGLFGSAPATNLDDAGQQYTNMPLLCPINGDDTASYSDVVIVGNFSESARTCATLSMGVGCWPSTLLDDGGLLKDGGGGLYPGGSWAMSTISGPDGNPLHSKQLAAGGAHVCALQTTGEVFCFGENGLGQLGDGTIKTSENRAVRVKDLSDAIWVGAGTAFTCAIRANGSVVCWGDNGHGQLGNNSTAQSLVPTPASALTKPVAMLSTCSSGRCDFMCAVTRGAELWCWGANPYLQLGQGTTGPPESHVPLQVQGL